MSVYYVIGSNSKIKNIDKLNLGFEEFVDIKKYITNYDFDKKFYYVSNPVMSELGYNITNYEDFYKDENKKRFANFIDFIKSNTDSQIEFYKFWCIFDKSNEDINAIYQEKTYNLTNFQLPDDKIEFEFNTKYVFNKKQ